LIAQIAQSLQPIIDIEKPWLSPHAFAPNPSNLMESEMLAIDQIFRTVQLEHFGGGALLLKRLVPLAREPRDLRFPAGSG
jgi:hypothetical protein